MRSAPELAALAADDPNYLTREELYRLAQCTADPSTLSPATLDRMEREKIGPFMHDWSDIV